MSEPERTARAQLSTDYARIMADSYRSRWSSSNPGNREIHLERDAVLRSLTRDTLPSRPLSVLDLGCGSLSILPESLAIDVRVGVYLLISRLIDLKALHNATPTVNGDGAHLPFPDESFDVVVLSTMMTSVLDDAIRRSVAVEVVRTLRIGGAVLWYDMRMPNPRSRATRAISRAELLRLFPSLRGKVKSLTVVPVVARRLGKFAPRGYALLRRLPPLRSHLAACLLKTA
jgi:SAM-dependent methyltransferase